MTTNEHTGVSEAEVHAAAERWSRAAGVPLSVAVDTPPCTPPAGQRFLRGLLLGALVGTLVLLAGSVAGAASVLGVLLGVAVTCLGARMALARRRARTAAGH